MKLRVDVGIHDEQSIELYCAHVNGIEMAATDSASPPSPATPSSAPGTVVSAADFAQHKCDSGGNSASTGPAAADGVMAGATVSPADKAVHRLQLLRGVRQTGNSRR